MLEVMMMDDGAQRGSLLLDAAKLRRFTDIQPTVISINAAFRPERIRVERFIEDTYSRAYGAQIQEHYPTLISARDESGAILAAAGFRFAANGALYLENYLSCPIQSACAERWGDIRRTEIAEIGNLSSAGRGASIFLFMALASHLEARGVKIAAVTATKRLRRMFRAVRFDSATLAQADTAKLADRGAVWGAYYDCDPLVLAGEVRIGRENLQRLYADTPTPKLVSRLHHDCRKDF